MKNLNKKIQNSYRNIKKKRSLDKTYVIQISKISFYFNFQSARNNISGMGRFKIQLLLGDDTWSTRYDTPMNGCYSNSSTQWTLVSLNFNK